MGGVLEMLRALGLSSPGQGLAGYFRAAFAARFLN
jgi:hypothetical protein